MNSTGSSDCLSVEMFRRYIKFLEWRVETWEETKFTLAYSNAVLALVKEALIIAKDCEAYRAKLKLEHDAKRVMEWA